MSVTDRGILKLNPIGVNLQDEYGEILRPNLYLIAELGNEIKKTSPSPDPEVNPLWKESLDFTVKENDDTLYVSLYEKFEVGKELVGEVIVKVDDLVAKRSDKLWFELLIEEESVGDLCIAFKFIPVITVGGDNQKRGHQTVNTAQATHNPYITHRHNHHHHRDRGVDQFSHPNAKRVIAESETYLTGSLPPEESMHEDDMLASGIITRHVQRPYDSGDEDDYYDAHGSRSPSPEQIIVKRYIYEDDDGNVEIINNHSVVDQQRRKAPLTQDPYVVPGPQPVFREHSPPQNQLYYVQNQQNVPRRVVTQPPIIAGNRGYQGSPGVTTTTSRKAIQVSPGVVGRRSRSPSPNTQKVVIQGKQQPSSPRYLLGNSSTKKSYGFDSLTSHEHSTIKKTPQIAQFNPNVRKVVTNQKAPKPVQKRLMIETPTSMKGFQLPSPKAIQIETPSSTTRDLQPNFMNFESNVEETFKFMPRTHQTAPKMHKNPPTTHQTQNLKPMNASQEMNALLNKNFLSSGTPSKTPPIVTGRVINSQSRPLILAKQTPVKHPKLAVPKTGMVSGEIVNGGGGKALTSSMVRPASPAKVAPPSPLVQKGFAEKQPRGSVSRREKEEIMNQIRQAIASRSPERKHMG